MNRSFPGLGAALGLLAAAVAAQALASFVLVRLWPQLELTWVAGWANLTALLAIAAWGYLLAGRRPVVAPVAGVGVGWWTGLVLSAVGATIVLGEVSNALSALAPLSPSLAQLFNQLTLGNPVATFFTIAFVAPVTEEALFRGVFLPGFVRRWGVWPAIVLSSALFAAFHLNIWQAPAAFVAGLFLGWLAVRTGSLLYPMAAHAMFNATPVVLAQLGVHITGYNTPLVPGSPEFQPWGWDVTGVVLLAAGLALTKRWAPLSPPPISS